VRFVERRAESIRVKGEYVPVPMVEEAYGRLSGIGDHAIWKRPGDLESDEVVLFTSPALPDVDEVREISASLAPFMRAVAVVAVDEIPRDAGVGKVQRRLLDGLERRAEVQL
jgi:acyl-CoA synthetase (AMP-forming)/AMP-acid ligase II